MREIEAARAQIEAQLALLTANPDRAELADDIGVLQAQLSQLDGLRGQALTGNLSQLATLQVTLTQSTATLQVAAMQTASGAGASVHQSVMLMSQDQLDALAQDHAAQSERYQHYEADMFTRIDALAAVNGRDMSGFHAMRDELQAEYEAAQANGDTVGMAEADALRATNLRKALETAGASDAEIKQAIAEEAARKQAYLEQVAMRARAEGEKSGLSGEALDSYVEQKVETAEERLEDRKTELSSKYASLFESKQSDRPSVDDTKTFEVAEANEIAPPSSTPRDADTEIGQTQPDLVR